MSDSPPTAINVANNLKFEDISNFAAMAESYAISASEAAWRGDQVALGVSLKQLRLTTIAALQTFKELDGTAAAPERAA